jgi:hypothetical protein
VPIEALRERRGERLDERDEHGHAREPRLRIADPDLDRAESRMRTEIPPDERVVVPRAGLLAALDERNELLEARERRRDAAPRHRVEHLRARRSQARVAAVPERRVRGRGEELRQPRSQRARDCDRLRGRLEADVDVQAEDQLPLDRPPQRLGELGVPRLLRHVLVLVPRERMGAGREHGDAARLRFLARTTAQLPSLGDRLPNRPRRSRRHLDGRLQQLRLDPLVDPRRLAEHLGVPRRELEALRAHELELLLHAERERSGLAVVDVHPRGAVYPRARRTRRGGRGRSYAGTGSVPGS